MKIFRFLCYNFRLHLLRPNPLPLPPPAARSTTETNRRPLASQWESTLMERPQRYEELIGSIGEKCGERIFSVFACSYLTQVISTHLPITKNANFLK